MKMEKAMDCKKNVLIIDDSAINRKICCKLLQNTYTLLEAANGEEGLRVLKERASEIDAVILDLVMPVMDGYEFLEHIAQNEQWKKIPILIATGDNERGAETRCLQLGAWDFVSKPYLPEVLRLRLKNIIDLSQMSLLKK